MNHTSLHRSIPALALALSCLIVGLAACHLLASPAHASPAGNLELAWESTTTDATRALAWGDWDNDGDLDLAVGNRPGSTIGDPTRVYENEGGVLSLAWSAPEPNDASSVAWGDWDNDGDLDLAVGNQGTGSTPEPNRVYENTGGSLVLAWESTAPDITRGVAWGDWDDDGDLDLLVGNWNTPSRVYQNLGDHLESTPSVSFGGRDNTIGVAWGDWDDDGDLDVAVANYNQPNRVYENTGGSLELAWSAPWKDYSYSVAWGDWDGDGDLDLAVGNDDRPNRVYENTGGSLELAWSAPLADYTRAVAWGDWDNDGDLDLAVGNMCKGTPEVCRPNRVYANTGGGLSLAWNSPELAHTQAVAWGDWDGDGYLDLAVGNFSDVSEPIRVYRNTGSRMSLDWSSPEQDETYSVAWGDWDGDGDLDLAVGNFGQPNRVYENDAGTLSLAWTAPLVEQTRDVAWGDWDGDGDLDLAVGNFGQPNRVYENDAAAAGNLVLAWTSSEQDYTKSVAWGDWDGDGDLDLAVANAYGPNRVYENLADSGGTLSLAWTAPVAEQTRDVAWGDWDGDGDLDLAVGNTSGPYRVYENDADAAGSLRLAWSSREMTNNYAASLAWGDCDGDGDLDLATAGYGPARLYENDAGSLWLAWTSAETGYLTSVAWGDWDGDRDLDLAVGSRNQRNRVYRNDSPSACALSLGWSSPEKSYTTDIAWGDWDGDGDLDLAAGNGSGDFSSVYENHTLDRPARDADSAPWARVDTPGGAAASLFASGTVLHGPTLPISYTLFDPEGDPARLVRGDFSLDGGGTWQPAVATTGTVVTDLPAAGLVRASALYTPTRAIPDGPAGTLTVTLPVSAAGSIADLEVWLNVTHTCDSDLKAVLVSPAGISVTLFEGVGGTGQDFHDTVLDEQAATSIALGAAPFAGVYRPQTGLRPLLGQAVAGTWRLVLADRAAGGTGSLLSWGLRILPRPAVLTYTWDVYGSGVFGASDNAVFRLDVYQGYDGPGAYQEPFLAAQTLPFRVRGSQVRVADEAGPVPGAAVYRQPAGQAGSFEPYHDGGGLPFQTNPAGYLQGYGQIALGDQLVALLPISATDTYTLYHTSAAPAATGLDAYSVTAMGVQTLTVTADHPLVLFNLDVSLQWDARNDAFFLAPFEFNLQRASELLYDWTDGQAALGRVRIYHNREHWNDAHLRVYASNRRRPSAGQGGIVAGVISDTGVISITYTAGQVHMGAVWNRYGEPGAGLGEDWARSLAHELGHYAFFLDDNYLGFDAGGQVIPVDTCPGAMADPYRQDYPYDEFHPAAAWLPECERTLSNRITGRSDWQTVETFYPWLHRTLDGHGPSGLPLDVTRLSYVEPVTPSTALEDPTFYLAENGARVQPGNGSRAFLYQDGWAVDLGRPVLDHIQARGARPGDEVCVYEEAARRLGCETVSAGDEQLEMATWPDWQPDIAVTPVDSVTLGVLVTNVPAGVLGMEARLYPMTAPATGTLPLVSTTGGYSGTFHLSEPAFEGYVRVCAGRCGTGPELVTDYAVGGNPASLHGSRASMRGRRVSLRSSQAPVLSADGQVILFVDASSFDEDEFYTLQAVSAVSPTLPWAAPVGQAYRLSASAHAPDLAGASISFSYMAGDVPEGAEPWLRIYYWDGLAWERLPGTPDTYYNAVSAPARGPGLYALMAGVEVPLYTPGWNLFGYPLQGTRPIADALSSLDGLFTTVYDWDAAGPDPYDRWRIYDVTWDPAYNTLHSLTFADTYWITVSQGITMYLKPGVSGYKSAGSPLVPPATFYGPVLPGSGYTPIPGMEVAAWIDGKLCGRGETLDLDGQVVYRVSVLADEPGYAAGCGEPGREVRFSVAGRPMKPAGWWGNASVLYLPLSRQYRHYLPLVVRGLLNAPDLVVERLVAGSENVQVVIRNQGAAPVRDVFWIDVYIGPRTPPTAANQTWDQLGEQGLVWAAGLDGLPLWPGEAITLTVGDDRYWPDYSHVDWPLSRTTPLYAQVDSASAGQNYGAVPEIDELRGLPYNNIAGPVYPDPGALRPSPASPASPAAPRLPSPALPARR